MRFEFQETFMWSTSQVSLNKQLLKQTVKYEPPLVMVILPLRTNPPEHYIEHFILN